MRLGAAFSFVATERVGALRAGALVAALLVACRSSGDKRTADLRVPDADGRLVAPLEAPGARAVVLVFVMRDCPISNAFAPEIERIRGEYAPRGVEFDLVYADPSETGEAARKHAAEFGHRSRVLLDPTHVLARFTGATKTPEAAVLSPAGEVLYLGRIDDRFVDYGRQRPAPRTRDLRAALDAILAGRSPEVARTEAVGCFLPDPMPSAR
jgi:hypothetical protein